MKTPDAELWTFLLPGANAARFESIITQVACETKYTIADADEPTCRSAIAALEACHGCSRPTKLRDLSTRLRKLARGKKRGAR